MQDQLVAIDLLDEEGANLTAVEQALVLVDEHRLEGRAVALGHRGLFRERDRLAAERSPAGGGMTISIRSMSERRSWWVSVGSASPRARDP